MKTIPYFMLLFLFILLPKSYSDNFGDFAPNKSTQIKVPDFGSWFDSASPATVDSGLKQLAASYPVVSSSIWTRLGTLIYPTTITDNVGIGNTAPMNLLQVGTSPNPPLFITPTNVGIGTTNPQALLQAGTGNSQGLFVTKAGNVGIGTTAPARRLQVVGDYVMIGDAGTINSMDGDGDLYVEDELEVDSSAYFNGFIYFYQTTIRSDNVFETYGTDSDVAVGFLNLGNDFFNIKVATGTVDYSGNIIISGGVSQDWGQPIVTDPHFRIQSADTTSKNDFIQFWHDQTDANIQVGSGKLIISGSTLAGDLLHIKSSGTSANMALRVSNTTPTDILAVLDNGNMGIGTTLPVGLLQVGTSPYPGLIVLPSGSVGIGTTAPENKLHIRRDIDGATGFFVENLTAGTGAEAFLNINSDSGAYEMGSTSSLNPGDGLYTGSGEYIFSNGVNGLSIVATDVNGVIRFGTGGYTNENERMHINADGKIGIGTTIPVARLEIVPSDTTPAQSLYINVSGSRIIMKSPDGTCDACGPSDLDVWTCTSVACPS